MIICTAPKTTAFPSGIIGAAGCKYLWAPARAAAKREGQHLGEEKMPVKVSYH
jgi:hypothetical protein